MPLLYLRYGFKEVKVPGFAATKFLITNREFLEFVNAGGYHKEGYWTTEGWKWCTSLKSRRYPHFWVPDRDGWNYRGMVILLLIYVPRKNRILRKFFTYSDVGYTGHAVGLARGSKLS